MSKRGLGTTTQILRYWKDPNGNQEGKHRENNCKYLIGVAGVLFGIDTKHSPKEKPKTVLGSTVSLFLMGYVMGVALGSVRLVGVCVCGIRHV